MEKINPFGPLMALMQHDLQEYEEKYQGTFAEMPHISLGFSLSWVVYDGTGKRHSYGDAERPKVSREP